MANLARRRRSGISGYAGMGKVQVTDAEFRQRAGELIEAGRTLYARGMVPATSGNFSARLSCGQLAITVLGSHKGRLGDAPCG